MVCLGFEPAAAGPLLTLFHLEIVVTKILFTLNVGGGLSTLNEV